MAKGGRNTVTVFPAIDLRRGCCVRLRQGDAEQETVYDADPREVALRYATAGAEWLHLVDLDGAFGEGTNRKLVRSLLAELPLRVQTGGGLRSEGDVAELLGAGAARVVIGTAALENPALVRALVERWGAERIAVGLDARGVRPAGRGWREEASRDLWTLGAAMVEMGVRTLVYTDIERDGMLAGPNLPASAELARRTGAEVIVSGGVRGAGDVRLVAEAARSGGGLSGVIVGRALYEGKVEIDGALAAARF